MSSVFYLNTLKENILPYRLFAFTAATFCMLFTQSCKDPNTGGKDLLPPDELIGMAYTDSVTVNMDSRIIDSIPTFGTDFHLFGNYVDNELGRISAGTYTQLRFSGDKIDFGSADSLRADSVVLFLDVIGYFGRLETPQLLKVHEITEKFDTTSYASNDSLIVNPLDLAGKSKINSGTVGLLKDVRVKLDKLLAEKLLFLPDSVKGKTNTEFTNYLKGLFISTYPVGQFTSREPGAIMYMSLQSNDSKLILYYSKKDSVGNFTQSKKFEFGVTSSARQFHSIRRSDYESRKLGTELMATTRPHEFEFNQSGAVIENYLSFPFLKNLGTVGINKAELIIKADPNTLGAKIGTTYRYAPPALKFYQPDSTLKKIESELIVSSIEFDNIKKQYVVSLTNYVQRILNGQIEDRGILIRSTDELNYIANTLNRVVIGGHNHPTLKPVLRVTYTTLPK